MSDNHRGLPHDLPPYTPNVMMETQPREEIVHVALGDDYYKGAYFQTEDGHLDYKVPKSQLERWQAAQAAYWTMQDEIEKVMDQQRDRVLALTMERRKGQPNGLPAVLQAAYEESIAQVLQQPPLLPEALRGPNYKDPE